MTKQKVQPPGKFAPRVPRETEKGFQEKVIALARLQGWLVFHPYDMRRSAYGYPDLTLVGGPKGNHRVLFVELKSEKGKLTQMQEFWGEALSRCPGVEYYCWRPSDWKAVERALGKEN